MLFAVLCEQQSLVSIIHYLSQKKQYYLTLPSDHPSDTLSDQPFHHTIACGTKREVSCVIKDASSRTPMPQARSATSRESEHACDLNPRHRRTLARSNVEGAEQLADAAPRPGPRPGADRAHAGRCGTSRASATRSATLVRWVGCGHTAPP